jgi:phosphoenolpyruvate carboxykinase (ATP)
LENVAVDERGRVDFFDDSYTANGRGTFELAEIPHFDPRKLGKADFLLILNRNEAIVPAVARMATKEQAVAYFMLGETMGTSAGGKAEEGKALRVPGTNPFFPLRDEMQANRFWELMGSTDIDVYLLNTGRVGGLEDDGRSKKIEISDSGAIVKAIAERSIDWERDPDFGYEVARTLPGVDDAEKLQPRLLYERTGRDEDYRAWVERFRRERVEFLSRYRDLRREILEAVS